MVCPIPKSDRQIETYHEIKFSLFACVVWGEADHVWLIEISFDWLKWLKLIKWIFVIG